METDKHYFRVGAFVLLTIAGLAAFSVWLSGRHEDSQYTPYRIHFNESVSGLEVGSPVKFRGVTVGKVDAMSIDPQDMRLIQVDISALKTTPVKTDTVATLKLQGITGNVYIELSGSTPEAQDLASNDAGQPPEIPSKPGALTAIMDMLPEILKKVSHIADQAEKLFSNKNVKEVSDTIDNVHHVTSIFGSSDDEKKSPHHRK